VKYRLFRRANFLAIRGTNLYEGAGYLGMSPETLWETYGHHHPDFQSTAANAVAKKGRKHLPFGTPIRTPMFQQNREVIEIIGRGSRIRTCGPLLPKQNLAHL